MDRVTLRMPAQQVEEIERLVDKGHYPNRSEAIRSLVRTGLNEDHDGLEHQQQYGTLHQG